MLSLIPTPRARFFDADGVPLALGKVYTYAAGTLNLLATYTDATGGTANTNPIILSTEGECDIWAAPMTRFKIVLKDKDDVVQWTRDEISSNDLSPGAALANITEGGAGWLHHTPQPNLAWISNNAGLMLANDDSYSLPIVGARRTSQMTGGAAIGITGVAYNDNATNKVQNWAFYGDAKSAADAKGATWSAELEITNLGTYVDYYEVNDRKTFGITLGAGGSVATNGTTEDVTAGLTFTANGSKFGIGITFGGSSLRAFTDYSGFTFYKAVALRSGMALCWEDATGNPLTNIRSAVTATANEVGILITDNNFYINGVDNSYIARFQHVANAVNYTYMYNAVTGGVPVYGVAGADTDIDIRISPKGAGYIQLGGIAWGSSSDVPINGYMTVKDNGGNIRKLATVA